MVPQCESFFLTQQCNCLAMEALKASTNPQLTLLTERETLHMVGHAAHAMRHSSQAVACKHATVSTFPVDKAVQYSTVSTQNSFLNCDMDLCTNYCPVQAYLHAECLESKQITAIKVPHILSCFCHYHG